MPNKDESNNSITLDEAVIVLMGHSLDEYRAARVDIFDELEVDLGYACYELKEARENSNQHAIARAETEIEQLEAELNCAARLYQSLCMEIGTLRIGRTSQILLAESDPLFDSLDTIRIRRDSLENWSKQFDNVGDHMPPTTNADLQPTTSHWEDITVILYAANKIGFKSGHHRMITQNLEGSRLLDNRHKDRPTEAGAALMGLIKHNSIRQKSGDIAGGISKKIMSELRTALKQLSGMDTDPFYPYNNSDGWKPRFKVRDQRKVGVKRAKETASHVSFEESLHSSADDIEYPYESEGPDDAADKYINDNSG